ncbi:HNH endonuclease [Pseudobutyrivibrio xylanivorans]|uniref:HNH domain-containing protein n=1 Tax=Pseudobutyrivibrio xylanivorans TaxID=185007 RepID=A0A5P6VRJ9_PSEXY|nr:HNH endonuclease [Pseudobutyrivibrio xylanivorans]QFJ55257.1 hypothetical protein FXF36_10480 [Pseudobutyrivibrio xylanivorans]
MGNLIMPKQTAALDRFFYSLEIFYKAYQNNDPDVTNEDFKRQITNHFEDLRERNDGAKIVKQSEMTRYFGFAYHSYANNTTTITDRGIDFYLANKDSDTNKCMDLIIESLENDTFGRNNTAIKTSDSYIDPPKLLTKAVVDFDGISRKDLALLLYLTHDMELSYDDAGVELNRYRAKSDDISIIITPEKVNKYSDTKFASFLQNIGFLVQDDERKYRLSAYVERMYKDRIKNLNIYNEEPPVIKSSNPILFDDTSTDTKDTDCNANYKENVSKTVAYDIHSLTFKSQNERIPAANPEGKSNYRYPTDTRLAKTALMLSGYLCEFDASHKTFTGKNEEQFMEGHHLIPMTAQKDFDINLDRIENIVSLCPNCHSAIHYGNDTDRKKVLLKLYNERQEELSSVGLNISFNDLFNKYYQ